MRTVIAGFGLAALLFTVGTTTAGAQGFFRQRVYRSEQPGPAPGPGPAPQADMVLRWNQILCNAVRADRTPPPLASRNMAIVHVAIYDAVNAVFRTHQPYKVDVQALQGSSPEAAAAAAAYATLSELYPQQKQMLDQEFRASVSQLPPGPGRDTGVSLGLFVAKQILTWRSKDGANNANAEYRLPNVAGLWQPTPTKFQQPLLPAWGRVKPFAIKELPHTPPPAALTSAAYTQAFEEVKALGGAQHSARTPEQTDIAIFWADAEGTVTPPGHWNQIAQTVALTRGQSLAENARMFALLNISMADAAIACWVIKFHHGFWRPVHAIRLADYDGNPHTAPDARWLPLLETPPFPAYTSGHSSFSGAAAAALADFYGNDQVAFTATSDGLPGAVRRFPSFSAAAAEAGQSRIYGGIHWQFDNVVGLDCGRAIGHHVARNYMVPRK